MLFFTSGMKLVLYFLLLFFCVTLYLYLFLLIVRRKKYHYKLWFYQTAVKFIRNLGYFLRRIPVLKRIKSLRRGDYSDHDIGDALIFPATRIIITLAQLSLLLTVIYITVHPFFYDVLRYLGLYVTFLPPFLIGLMCLIVVEITIIGIKSLGIVLYNTIKNLNDLKEFKKRQTFLQVMFGLLLLVAIPVLVFAYIYQFILSLPIFQRDVTFNILEYVYYSTAISYSLPSDNIIDCIQNEINSHKWMKAVPILQIVVQHIIDIFLYGYIANLILNMKPIRELLNKIKF